MHRLVYPRPKCGALALQQAGIVILMLKYVIGTTILHIIEIDTKKLCYSESPSVSRRVIFHLLTCPHMWPRVGAPVVQQKGCRE